MHLINSMNIVLQCYIKIIQVNITTRTKIQEKQYYKIYWQKWTYTFVIKQGNVLGPGNISSLSEEKCSRFGTTITNFGK